MSQKFLGHWCSWSWPPRMYGRDTVAACMVVEGKWQMGRGLKGSDLNERDPTPLSATSIILPLTYTSPHHWDPPTARIRTGPGSAAVACFLACFPWLRYQIPHPWIWTCASGSCYHRTCWIYSSYLSIYYTKDSMWVGLDRPGVSVEGDSRWEGLKGWTLN